MTTLNKFIGLERLKRKLRKIPKKIRAANMRALEKNAQELAEMQRRLAPVATGSLQKSIRVRLDEATESAMVIAGDNEAYYAAFVEFGTVNSPSQAFFFPAYRANKKRMKSRVRRASRKAVKEIART